MHACPVSQRLQICESVKECVEVAGVANVSESAYECSVMYRRFAIVTEQVRYTYVRFGLKFWLKAFYLIGGWWDVRWRYLWLLLVLSRWRW